MVMTRAQCDRCEFRSRKSAGFSSMRTFALLGFALGLSACAEVAVRKVPIPSHYIEWSDRMQREADEMEGFRFYLPRPFVNVIESFPIRTQIYLADGIVSADGRFVEIFQVRGETGGAKFGKVPSMGSRIDTRMVGRPLDTATGVQSDQDKDDTNKIEPSIPQDPSPVSDVSPESTKTGLVKQGVTNDNSAYAYQPMRGNFDVVYLPDFDEQYVISGSAGLGTAEFQLNLGQGWSLQGFESLADNSALNSRIFDVIDAASQKAQATAIVSAGVPPTLDLQPGTTATVPQSGQDAVMVAGTRVTLKVVVVHYAAKGLYPIIKPREFDERVKGDVEYFLWFDLFQQFPIATPGSTSNDGTVASARESTEAKTLHATIPRYPYQYISFNSFRYIAIEALTPSAHPFGTLYDRTGTRGEPGHRRLEVSPVSMSGLPSGSLGAGSFRDPLDELQGQLITIRDSKFVISEKPVIEDSKIKITLTHTGSVEPGIATTEAIDVIHGLLGDNAPDKESIMINSQYGFAKGTGPSLAPVDESSEPSEPQPAQPPPSAPEPSEPQPAQPPPSEAEPSEPQPAQPPPSEAEPSEPQPAQPLPSAPELSEPQPAQPPPSAPEPSEPQPAQPPPSEVEQPDTEPSPASNLQSPQLGRVSIADLAADQIRSIQAALCLRGKGIDGLWGEQTRQMLILYQQETGRAANGILTTDLLKELQGLTAAAITHRCQP